MEHLASCILEPGGEFGGIACGTNDHGNLVGFNEPKMILYLGV
jgi:hypothetical protein